MPHSSAASDPVFRALADPTRRAILASLRQGRQPAGEIARRFPISRPAISKHLRLLCDAKLLVETRSGRNRLYELNAKPLQAVDEWIDGYRAYWRLQLRNLKRHIEKGNG